jgi:hypothetical protein
MRVQIQLKTTISCLHQNCTIISLSMSVVVIYIVYSGFWLVVICGCRHKVGRTMLNIVILCRYLLFVRGITTTFNSLWDFKTNKEAFKLSPRWTQTKFM